MSEESNADGAPIASHCYASECSPKSLAFEDVNEFVHKPGQEYENLQWLCLSLASALDDVGEIELVESSVPFDGQYLDGWPKKPTNKYHRSMTPENVLVAALQVAEDCTKNDELKPLYKELRQRIRNG